MTSKSYGLEQARSNLPSIVAEAGAGSYTVITKHGKALAAVVPVATLAVMAAKKAKGGGILALAGSGLGLWGANSSKTIAALRDEWK